MNPCVYMLICTLFTHCSVLVLASMAVHVQVLVYMVASSLPKVTWWTYRCGQSGDMQDPPRLASAAVQLFTREARASKLPRMLELSRGDTHLSFKYMFIAYFV